jgi:hypothetical protein
MKKKLLMLLAVLGVVGVLAPASAFAAAPSATPATPGVATQIDGIVTNNGKPVKNAKVTIVCNGHAKSTTTTKTGAYSVKFKAGQCAVGSKVTVVATKKGSGGVGSGIVSAGTVKLNVSIVNVALPEFGLITGFAGAAAAIAAFFVIRRRQVEQN